MLLRILVLAAVVAVLAVAGVIDLSGLPWGDPDFRASGSIVLLYMLWSVTETRTGSDALSLPRLGLYTVLLVSAVDSLLLRLTIFHGLFMVRYAGSAVFATGSILRFIAFKKGSGSLLRVGRIMQLTGLPAGFGSVAGLIIGILPGSISALKESLPDTESLEE
jgi:hypothetical protein